MKIIKNLIIIVLLAVLISCPNYTSILDPDAEEYQGWPLLEDGEEGEPWVISETSPSNNGEAEDWTPLFDWPDMENASGYKVQWALSEADLNNASVVDVTGSEYQVTQEMALNDKVFWRIKIIGTNGGSSAWSSALSFSIIPWEGSITEILPEDGETTVETSPFLQWTDVTGASSYEVQVASSFAGVENSVVKTVTTSAYQLTETLIVGDTRYWRIRVKTSGEGYSTWSSIFSFSIVAPWNVAITGQSPSNGESLINKKPLLNWNNISGANSYDVQIATTAEDVPGASIHNVTVSEYQLTEALSVGDTLYWRVRANSSTEGISLWCITSTLSIVYWDVSITGISPANGIILSDTTPLFEWNEVMDATLYEVRYALTTEDLSTAMIYTAESPEYLVPAELLVNTDSSLHSYKWQVRALKTNSESDWSPISTFTIEINGGITVVPHDDVIDISLNISDGATITIPTGGTSNVTATTDPSVSSFLWYLDGVLIDGQNTATLAVGTGLVESTEYALTVIAIDGVIMASKTIAFLVDFN